MKNKILIISTIALTGVLALDSDAKTFWSRSNTHDLPTKQTFFDSDSGSYGAATAPTLQLCMGQAFNDKFYYGMGDGRANNHHRPIVRLTSTRTPT